MLRSLQSGISGLQAHQMYLDVIGNNLANANTTGYKGSRMNFIDMFNQTLRHASSPSSSRGGTNPVQIGLGVRGGSIDPNMNQGALITTGRPFDIGIQGQGYFVLSDGAMNHYTRAGTFALDANNYLVDQATGMLVQSPTLTDIEIETQESLPPSATSLMQVAGNLPAEVTGPLAEVLTTNTPFQEGTEASITGSVAGPYAFTDGDTMTIRVNGGAAQTVTFNTADFANIGAATATEVAAVINADVTGVTATDVGGAIQIMSDAKGENASIDIDDGTGMPATAMGLNLSQINGTQVDADATTNLNRLVSNTIAYVNGDVINISGKDGNGQVVDVNFIYGTNGTTLDQLRAFINTNFTGASCTIDSSGNLVLTADTYGEADLSLIIMDNENYTGRTSWSSFAVTTDGADPDEVTTSISVFDVGGEAHTLSLRFERVYDPPGQPIRRAWDLHIPHPNNNTESVIPIRFNSDGSYAGPTGTSITIILNGSDSQNIELDLGTVNEYDGLTMTGGGESVQVINQDGYAAGDLASMSIDLDGTIMGLYTNGQFQDLGYIGIAMFNNPAGLEKEGDSFFFTSPNSGTAAIGTPGSGGAGTLLAGTLEESNVDISEEFVNMIEAQRGFQANARVITTSDEVLAETVNLV